MRAFVGQITDKYESRNKSFVAYHSNTGFIEDDYYFRIMVNMEDNLRATITTLVNSSTGISAEKIIAVPMLDISKYKYNPEEHIGLDMSIKDYFKSKEDFSVVAYKILDSLYSSKLNFKKIEIYSFTPENGDEAYTPTLDGPTKPSSLEEVKKMVYIKGFEKK